jgi:hypothetical protein
VLRQVQALLIGILVSYLLYLKKTSQSSFVEDILQDEKGAQNDCTSSAFLFVIQQKKFKEEY